MTKTEDVLARARNIVSGMTPGPWREFSVHTYGHAQRHVGPGRTTVAHVHLGVGGKPQVRDANAAGIVLATNLLRTLTSEGAEEGVARALASCGGDPDDPGHGSEPLWMAYTEDARTVISHFLAQAIGEQP